MNGLLADSLIVIDGDCLVVSIGSNFFLKREKQFCGSKVFPHRHSKTLHTKTPIDYNYEYLLQFIYSYRDWMDESWPVVMRDASRSKNQLELVDYRPVGSSVSTQWERGGESHQECVCVCVFKAHLPASIDGTLQRIRHQPCAGSDIYSTGPLQQVLTYPSIYLSMCVVEVARSDKDTCDSCPVDAQHGEVHSKEQLLVLRLFLINNL
jgi:hypothetical protein